jgi:hypothetical protein
MDVTKMFFRKMESFRGQHSFWMELGGFARIAIADQSVMGREGYMYQPQHADHGLLFVDFHTIAEQKYELKESTSPGSQRPIWALPVIDIDGEKFTTILVKEEYDWFMSQWGVPKKEKKPESILVE